MINLESSNELPFLHHVCNKNTNQIIFLMTGRGLNKGGRLVPLAHPQAVLVRVQVVANPDRGDQGLHLLARQLGAFEPCQARWNLTISEETSTSPRLRIDVPRRRP